MQRESRAAAGADLARGAGQRQAEDRRGRSPNASASPPRAAGWSICWPNAIGWASSRDARGVPRAPAGAARVQRAEVRSAAPLSAGSHPGHRGAPERGHRHHGTGGDGRGSVAHRRRAGQGRRHRLRRHGQDAAREVAQAVGGSGAQPESQPSPDENQHGHQSRRNLQDHPRPDRRLRRRRRRRRSGHGHLARRRHRPRPRLRAGHGRRDARVPARRVRHRAEPRGGQRRLRAAGRIPRHQGRRPGQAHRPHHLGAGGRGDARPRGQRARPADRRQGPDPHQDTSRRSSGWRPASSTASRCASRCRPASRPSTAWCRSAAASAS